MANFKEKTQSFFFGLMAGLLIAGAFFILKLDTYFKELNFYKRLSQTNKEEAAPKENTENKTIQPVTPNYKFPYAKKDTAKISVTNDSLSAATKKLSENSVANNDSLVGDSLKTVYTASDGENIIVKKDEFLLAKNIEVINLNGPAVTTKKDSVLQQLSGIHNDVDKPVYTIEYWQSPINYRGYKMAKNKIIVYGLNASDAIKLYKLDDHIYLKDVSTVYHLDYANDYRQYEKVNEEGLLAKLK